MSEQSNQKGKLPPAAIAGIILFVLCGISLYIRMALPYDQVFVNGTVWFKGTDAWYHMRLVDNLLHHFPHRILFDPYTFYPYGNTVGWPPFFDWLVAAVAWLVGLGSPSQHTIDVVGAYIPPILGTLTIIPVYFIGKELFNRWVGLLAAALVVILPGEFLNRSLLGFTDHHVAESLFTTVVILFLILAVKKAKERKISFGHLINRNWQTITRPLIYTLLAGIFLGIYLLTWVGGLLFVFIIFAWLVIQFIIDHLKGKSTDYLCIIGTLSFLVACIIFLPALGQVKLATICRASLAIAIVTPLVLSGISHLMKSKAIKPIYYLPAIFGLAGIGFGIFHAVDPSLLHSMLSRFSIFTPAGAGLTILEVHPLLFPYDHFSLNIAWLNFTTTFFISFISFGWLIYRNIKEETADRTLFLVWGIVMLAAVLGQRRFSYYYAINAALLTGYFSWRILDFAGLRKLLAPAEAVAEVVRKAKKKRKAEARAREKALRQRRAIWTKVIVAGVVIFFLVFFPCIGLPGIKPYTKVLGLRVKLTQPLANEPALIDHAWCDSLLWLKDNTPEPFGTPDSYYELYQSPSPGESYKYPESAYSVMSWWDYGHWITRIAHRIPISNPFQQGAKSSARFFTAQDEDSANQMIDKLGSKYVVIDYAMPSTKFYAMPEFIGGNSDEFYEIYYQPAEAGKLEPIPLFYPTYYRSTVVRLYNFDREAVEPKDSIIVISYEEKLSQEGVWYKEITSSESFSTYEEAEAYISSQELGNYKIVGTDPLTCPVPLEEMTHYQLVYSSAQKWQGKPAVKIFEYTK